MNGMRHESRKTARDASATPIRTPEAYRNAIDEALALLAEAMQARRSGDPRADEMSQRAMQASENVSSAPFLMRDGEVVAKGFLPRIVR